MILRDVRDLDWNKVYELIEANIRLLRANTNG